MGIQKIEGELVPHEIRPILTRSQTASLLGITLPTLHSYTKMGIIPSYRIGGIVRYKLEEVLNSLKGVKWD
jgi:DNA-binding transcriptional MerR regulator